MQRYRDELRPIPREAAVCVCVGSGLLRGRYSISRGIRGELLALIAVSESQV